MWVLASSAFRKTETEVGAKGGFHITLEHSRVSACLLLGMTAHVLKGLSVVIAFGSQFTLE